MRVLTSDPNQLILRHRPWALSLGAASFALAAAWFALGYLRSGDTAGAIAAGLVLLVSLGIFAAFTRRIAVIFDRAANLVVLREVSLFGSKETTHPLDQLRKARVDANVATKSDDVDTHRPVLDFQSGTLPLTPVFASGSGAARAVEAINHWLSLPTA